MKIMNQRINNPKEIMKLIMAFVVALQQKTLTATWTNHAIERALLKSRRVPDATRKSAAKRRPINLGLDDANWYLSLDNKGDASIAIMDSVYGAMFVCCNSTTWLIKTVTNYPNFKKQYKPMSQKYLFGLIEKLGSSTNKKPESILKVPMGQFKKTKVPKTNATRSDARRKLKQLPRKTLMDMRRHLRIFGNGTNKPGAVSTEYAIESILIYMDARGEYSLYF